MALGLGYEYQFKNGFGVGFEWAPAWGQYPMPEYKMSDSTDLSSSAKQSLQTRMDREFKSSVTNMYKVFHLGISYGIR